MQVIFPHVSLTSPISGVLFLWTVIFLSCQWLFSIVSPLLLCHVSLSKINNISSVSVFLFQHQVSFSGTNLSFHLVSFSFAIFISPLTVIFTSVCSLSPFIQTLKDTVCHVEYCTFNLNLITLNPKGFDIFVEFSSMFCCSLRVSENDCYLKPSLIKIDICHAWKSNSKVSGSWLCSSSAMQTCQSSCL